MALPLKTQPCLHFWRNSMWFCTKDSKEAKLMASSCIPSPRLLEPQGAQRALEWLLPACNLLTAQNGSTVPPRGHQCQQSERVLILKVGFGGLQAGTLEVWTWSGLSYIWVYGCTSTPLKTCLLYLPPCLLCTYGQCDTKGSGETQKPTLNF